MSNDKFDKAFLLYADDWLTDDKLNLCSYSAKGLWIDILCRMHKSQWYGYLYANDKPLDKRGVYKITNFKDAKEFEKAWDELIENGVMKEEDGVFYSKRLIEERARLEAKFNKTYTKIAIPKERHPDMVEVKEYIEDQLKREIVRSDNLSILLNELMDQGFKKEDFKKVIDHRKTLWFKSDVMKQQLVPRTLFAPQNFERYLADARVHNKSTKENDGPKYVPPKRTGFDEY